MRFSRGKSSTARQPSRLLIATASAGLIATVSWDLVRSEGAGWNDRLVLLQQFESGQYGHLGEHHWLDFVVDHALWYRAVEGAASVLGGFKSTLGLLSFLTATVYAVSVLSVSIRLLPLLFVPMQIDLFDTQIRSACAGAVLLAAFRSNSAVTAMLLAVVSMSIHSMAVLLILLWLSAVFIEKSCDKLSPRSSHIASSSAVFLCGGVALPLAIDSALNRSVPQDYSISVMVFCLTLFVLGLLASARNQADRLTLFVLMVLLIIVSGGPLGLGLQRLLPITMPWVALVFVRFSIPYRVVVCGVCLFAQSYWTVKWASG